MIKGIVFDFNGTMFFDTPKHELAFKILIKEILNKDINDKEFKENINGRTNETIFKYLYKNNISDEDILKYSALKEEKYRQLCLEDKDNFHLATGLIELLDMLKDKDVPIGIATSSDKTNMDFYIENFGLLKWFDIKAITYNDGTIRSKPHPDIFIKACENIGISPDECLVFEDTVSGICSAVNAGVKNIVAVNSGNNSIADMAKGEIVLIINNYIDKLLVKLVNTLF